VSRSGEKACGRKGKMRLARGMALPGILIMLALGAPSLSQETAAGEQRAVVAMIRLKGAIDYGAARFMERSLEAASKAGATHIVLELDTYGGQVDSAEIIHALLRNLEDIKTIAYVSEKALSAGALIALSCNSLVMRQGTRIGDVEPLMQLPWGEPKGLEELAEKIQTELRAVFRTNAQRNGYPEKLSEAMVTKELEVLRVTMDDGAQSYMFSYEFDHLPEAEKAKVAKKEVIVRAGELLTMTAEEAKDLGFAAAVVRNEEELLEFYGLGAAKVVDISPTWSERLAGLIQTYSFVFLALGLLGIYVELKTPGFGAPGILGIACIAIFLFGKYVAGLADAMEIMFFVVGIGLLALEIFVIPGFGVAGILGILFIIAGIYLASLPFWIPRELPDFQRLTTWAWQFSLAVGSVIVVGLVLARYLPKVGLPGKLMITARERAEEGYVAGARETEGLLEREGRSVTKLRPAGKAEIDGRVVDVVTKGEFVEKGERVVVIEARGTKVVVRKA